VKGGAGGLGKGEVPKKSATFVERIATTISTMKGMLISRVPVPLAKSSPPMISNKAIAGARTPGRGIPSLVNRPTPWFVYANLSKPSEKKTPPAMSRMTTVDRGPEVGDWVKKRMRFLKCMGWISSGS